MKTSVKFGIFLSLVWISIILIAYLSGFSSEFFAIGILMNIFCLLAAISAGLFMTRKEKNFEHSIFLDDFKSSLQAGLVYTIFVSGFIYLYHQKIDTSIRENLISQRISLLHETYPNQESFKKLQESDAKWADKNFDMYIEEQEDMTKDIYSSFSVFIFHMMGLFIFSMFFSFFSTIIIRKVVLRQ